MKSKLWTAEDVAEYTGYHPERIRERAREGTIPAFKWGNRWAFDPSLIKEWWRKGAPTDLSALEEQPAVQSESAVGVSPTIPAGLQDEEAIPWGLLNAAPERIREMATRLPPSKWGRRYKNWPKEQVDDAIRLREAFRALYQMIAVGELATLTEACQALLAGEAETLEDGAKHLMDKQIGAAGTIMSLFEEYLPTRAPVIWPPVEPEVRYDITWNLKREGKHTFITAIGNSFMKLINGLAEITPGDVCVCEHCGRIGPAQRSDKRYCSANCRAKASQQRQK